MGYDGRFGDSLREILASTNGHQVEAVEESDPRIEDGRVVFMVSMEEAAVIEEELGYRPPWMRRYVDDLILPEGLTDA
jgi:hypothetical protein